MPLAALADPYCPGLSGAQRSSLSYGFSMATTLYFFSFLKVIAETKGHVDFGYFSTCPSVPVFLPKPCVL